MKRRGDRTFECPNCYYRVYETDIREDAHNMDCPGCKTETLNYFTPVEEEDECEQE